MRGTNDHIAVGIGGARQAVLSAAALRCLGGELQAQFWPTSRGEIEQAQEYGIDDLYKVFETEELAPGEVIVAATGVTNGDLLRGVRFLTDSARTHSLVMCTRHNWCASWTASTSSRVTVAKRCAFLDRLGPCQVAKR